MSSLRVAAAAAVTGLAGLIAFGAVWSERAEVADYLVGRGLAISGFNLAARVDQVEPYRMRLSGVRFGDRATPSVTLEQLDLELHPFEAFAGRVRLLATQDVLVRLVLDEDGVRLFGLPHVDASPREPGRGVHIPRLSVPLVRVIVTTPAGDVQARLSVKGDPSAGWSATSQFEPAELQSDDGELALVSGDATASLIGGRLQGRVDVETGAATLLGYAAEAFSFTAVFAGDVGDMTRLSGVKGDGSVDVALTAGGMDPARADAFAAVVAPAPLLDGPLEEFAGPHLVDLRAALADAMQNLDAQVGFDLSFTDQSAAVTLRSPIQLASASGAVFDVAPAAGDGMGRAALTFGDRVLTFSGFTADIAGGGLPSARVALETLTLSGAPDAPGVAAAASAGLDAWEAGGLTVGAELTRLSAVAEDGVWRADLTGAAQINGPRFGVELDTAVLGFDIAASGGPGYVRVAPRTEAAQTLTVRRADVGGAAIRDISTGIAPLSTPGDLAVVDDEGFRSVLALSGVRADLGLGDAAWSLRLPAAEVRVETGEDGGTRFGARAQAPRAELKAAGAEQIVQASLLEATATLADATEANVRFEGLALSGAGAPVSVERAAGELDLVIDGAAVRSGRFALVGAELRDTNPLAAYAPMLISGSGPIENGVLDAGLSATLLDGRAVATGAARYDIAAGRATLTFRSTAFSFAPNGMQPANLSPALRRHIVSAKGAFNANGRMTWDAGVLSAEATLNLTDLAFDTNSGHVAGLTTQFKIADLLALRTAEAQLVRIGSFDPGLPLEDGEVFVSLLGGGAVGIDGATFPFAGGMLSMEPFVIAPDEERVAATMNVEGIDLAALAGLVRPPNLNVTGRVSGKFPIEARDRSVFIANGVLTSLNEGEISYTGEAGDGLAAGNESAKLAFDALKNFEYSKLQLTLDGDVNKFMDLKIRTEGSNPDVYDGYPIVFNLTTSGNFKEIMRNAFSAIDLRSRLKQFNEAENEANEAE